MSTVAARLVEEPDFANYFLGYVQDHPGAGLSPGTVPPASGNELRDAIEACTIDFDVGGRPSNWFYLRNSNQLNAIEKNIIFNYVLKAANTQEFGYYYFQAYYDQNGVGPGPRMKPPSTPVPVPGADNGPHGAGDIGEVATKMYRTELTWAIILLLGGALLVASA